jgi:hypothetical protein
MLGSHPVGPYTSVIGTTSYESPGQKRTRKVPTRVERVARDSRTCGYDFEVRRVSSRCGGLERKVVIEECTHLLRR